MSTQTVRVAGMTCHHCVMSVSEEVGEIEGVSGVDVDLVAGGTSTVTITAENPVSDEAIAAAVAEAGYAVVRDDNLL
ncbi:cation transporter [Isoptericola sp. b441]|uniref:Cation transporter n=1 Tax=Actinotalea lenta TaxID=3064654 RepID=A0ABT9D5Y5_9CELL|nr:MULTISPECIES: cation transporter [unclassified Isoptericola]MDO8106216.1 cation transporter [Isoptericola sp. b441]MDO8122064.1 cation transporter [Isoptericola sp. b490]